MFNEKSTYPDCMHSWMASCSNSSGYVQFYYIFNDESSRLPVDSTGDVECVSAVSNRQGKLGHKFRNTRVAAIHMSLCVDCKIIINKFHGSTKFGLVLPSGSNDIIFIYFNRQAFRVTRTNFRSCNH
jgi:hypothetical protein